MGHEHHHHATQNITVAFFLNLIFAIIELIGGLLTNSIAILSDALHDFGDSISLGVAWYFQRLSDKKRDRFYSYGYSRFSLLGAIFISLVLLVGSGIIIRECIGRILDPVEPDALGMFWLSILGVIVNGAAVLRLRKGNSQNERAVTLHMMEDVLGWVAVLVVSVVMMFVNWPILDPLLSIGISIWVLINVYRNLKSTFKILMQEVPRNIDLKALEAEIVRIQDVKEVHDIHVWSLDGEEHILSCHLVISRNLTLAEWQDIKKETRLLCRRYNINHTTIEPELNGEYCVSCDVD